MTPTIKIIGGALAGLALTGCTYRVGDLTLASTKNLDLTDVQLDARTGRRFSGEDCRFVFLSLIPFGLPNLETAIDRALEAGKGNVMVDQVTEYKEAWVGVGHIACLVAKGTVLNSQQPAGLSAAPKPKASESSARNRPAIAPPPRISPAPAPNAPPKPQPAPAIPATASAPEPQGLLSFEAERLAIDAGCATADGLRPAAALIQAAEPVQVYDIDCRGQHMMVRCEYQVCRLLK